MPSCHTIYIHICTCMCTLAQLAHSVQQGPMLQCSTGLYCEIQYMLNIAMSQISKYCSCRVHVHINMVSQGIIVKIRGTCTYVSTKSMNSYRLVVKKVVMNKESLVRRRDGNINMASQGIIVNIRGTGMYVSRILTSLWLKRW